jgi:hypothetical protein
VIFEAIMEMKPNPREITAIENALRKAFIAPRGIMSGYLSCLSQQDTLKLKKMHDKYGGRNSLKKFAEKIRKGEYEYRLFVE